MIEIPYKKRWAGLDAENSTLITLFKVWTVDYTSFYIIFIIFMIYTIFMIFIYLCYLWYLQFVFMLFMIFTILINWMIIDIYYVQYVDYLINGWAFVITNVRALDRRCVRALDNFYILIHYPVYDDMNIICMYMSDTHRFSATYKPWDPCSEQSPAQRTTTHMCSVISCFI